MVENVRLMRALRGSIKYSYYERMKKKVISLSESDTDNTSDCQNDFKED